MARECLEGITGAYQSEQHGSDSCLRMDGRDSPRCCCCCSISLSLMLLAVWRATHGAVWEYCLRQRKKNTSIMHGNGFFLSKPHSWSECTAPIPIWSHVLKLHSAGFCATLLRKAWRVTRKCTNAGIFGSPLRSARLTGPSSGSGCSLCKRRVGILTAGAVSASL